MRKQKIQEWRRQKRRRQKIPEGRLQKSVKSHFLVGSFGSLQISVKSTVIAIRLLAILEPVLSFDSSPFAGSKVEHRSLRRSFAQQRCPTTMPNNDAPIGRCLRNVSECSVCYTFGYTHAAGLLHLLGRNLSCMPLSHRMAPGEQGSLSSTSPNLAHLLSKANRVITNLTVITRRRV